ncbi:MAG: cell wall-binding repeat-containing protein [Desulfitobacteriaceae bacterium]
MKKTTKSVGILVILILTLLLPAITFANAATASTPTSTQVTRIWGQNRYETATKIADSLAVQLNINFTAGEQFENVVLASGNNFPDALAGAALARQANAPMLLLDTTPEASQITWNYIQAHVNKWGNVYILGGRGVIPFSFTRYLVGMDFDATHIYQIGGKDRNETSLMIAKLLPNHSAFVLVSDSDFYDALTIASIASSDPDPILLVPDSGLTLDQQNYLDQLQPYVFVIGELEKTNGKVLINRYPKSIGYTGANRYATNAAWCTSLKNRPKVYLATGEDYPDALAGAVLAGMPSGAYGAGAIVLTTPDKLQPETVKLLNQTAYYAKLSSVQGSTVLPPVNYPQLVVFGGSAAVSDAVVNQVQQILNGPGYP